MYHDKKQNCMIWLVALPEGFTHTEKYEPIDFPGGFYAVRTAKDGGEADMDRVRKMISAWIKESECFEESNIMRMSKWGY